MEKLYKHTQTNYFLQISAGIIILIGIINTISNRSSSSTIILLIILALLTAINSKMTIEVTQNMLIFYMGLGAFRKEISLTDIEQIQFFNHFRLLQYGFYFSPDGNSYRVGGSTGIKLTLKNNKKYNLGTNDLENLMKYLDKRVPHFVG